MACPGKCGEKFKLDISNGMYRLEFKTKTTRLWFIYILYRYIDISILKMMYIIYYLGTNI